MSEMERAKEIDEAVRAADAKKRADAEEAAMAGEKLDKVIAHLDSLNRRMDEWDEKSKSKDEEGEGEGEIEKRATPENLAPIRSSARIAPPTRKRSRIISARLAPLIRLRLTPFSPKFKPKRTGRRRHGGKMPLIHGKVKQLYPTVAARRACISNIRHSGRM